LLLPQVQSWAESVYEVDERVLRTIADTETPAGIVVVLRRPVDARVEAIVSSPFGVILDGLGDPGNAGTIMRTAAAAGAGYAVASPGTVDLYSPKVVRAGMGAHFHLDVVQDVGWDEIRDSFREISLVACDISAPNSVYEMSWPCPMALVVGSEAHGLSKEARDAVHSAVRIPMRPGVESLNASVAAAIVMYEARGRRIESDEARYR
jgi:TrmH family RNA methyltransferase